jgi:hypothetical protein
MPRDELDPDTARGGRKPVPGGRAASRALPLLRAQKHLLLPMLHQARRASAELSPGEPAKLRVDLLARAASRVAELARRGSDAAPAADFGVGDLSSIAREVIQLFAGTLPGDTPVLQVAWATAPLVLGDELLLYQLIVEVLAAAAARAGGTPGAEIRVEVDAAGSAPSSQPAHVRLTVRIAPIADAVDGALATCGGFDQAQLELARDLVAFHGGRIGDAGGGGLRIHLPSAAESAVPSPKGPRLAVGLEDGSLTMAHVDASLRRVGRDVVTATHASSASVFATVNRDHVGLCFATADRPGAPGHAWLRTVASSSPALPCYLVVPDGADANEVVREPGRGIRTVTPRTLEGELARHDAGAGR